MSRQEPRLPKGWMQGARINQILNEAGCCRLEELSHGVDSRVELSCLRTKRVERNNFGEFLFAVHQLEC